MFKIKHKKTNKTITFISFFCKSFSKSFHLKVEDFIEILLSQLWRETIRFSIVAKTKANLQTGNHSHSNFMIYFWTLGLLLETFR